MIEIEKNRKMGETDRKAKRDGTLDLFEITEMESIHLAETSAYSVAPYTCIRTYAVPSLNLQSSKSASSYNDLLACLFVHASYVHILVDHRVGHMRQFFVAIYQTTSVPLTDCYSLIELFLFSVLFSH